MYVDWTYDGCEQDEERKIERCWEVYQQELESKLGALPLEPSELRLAVAHDSDSDEWEVQAALHLPNKTLSAHQTAESIERVFDRVVAALVREVDEQSDIATVIERRRQGLQAILPLLERNRSANRSDGFFTFLHPLMQTLRTHAERELEILELEGTLAGEDVEPDDVLDEAMLRAWERFGSRPPDVAFDLWLIGLIHEVVAKCAEGLSHESLQQERESANPDEDEPTSSQSWIENTIATEPLEIGDLLPGHPGVDSWDRLDLETKQTRLTRLLSVLTREERQTLVLGAVEGYELQDIARFQDRPLAEVTQVFERARQKLSDALK